MSQSAATEQTFAYGRYSKRKRTQVTYFMDELAVSDDEFDLEGVQTKKRKPATAKRLPKSKIFSFMDLPAEIRNIIYTYTLSDTSGVNLVGTFKHKRRTVERVSNAAQDAMGDSSQYYSGASKINDNIRCQYAEPTVLVPALLAVNKQINQECRDILYANDFVFTDSFALYNFIINLGPSGAKLLKSVRIKSWGFGRAMKAYNHSCFAVLAWATNIQKLVLDKTPGWSRNPKGTADQLYRDAFPWLEAVGIAKGKMDAALDVMEFGEDAFEHTRWYNRQYHSVDEAENVKMFRERMGVLLGQQQKRVMAKTIKKRKIARDGATDEL